ncbi:MAG: 6-phosphofructokinase [Chloroflexota bacterium]
MAGESTRRSIGVLTSGGDAPGMNPAVRSVVRTAIKRGVDVYAIYEGYRGMVEGGDRIRKMSWGDVGGILYLGGTIIGSARSKRFRERDGRRQAAKNLIERDIDRIIVIGGDGSLTGANIFRQEWPELLNELVEMGEITREKADEHPHLIMAGMVGSIDNDMFGTDMTIGADTALHRITEAIDAITSTASSHQRSFVIEVMGRNCGYLALMSAIATGANWVLIPEAPPESDDWESEMCDMLRDGRQRGRRASIVVIAEGAQDKYGNPISSDYVRQVLEDRIGEDTRVTVLGHVQRGGAPSAFERYMSTQLGYVAVDEVLTAQPGREPQLIGLRKHRVVRSPLMQCVEKTHAVARHIKAQEYDEAMKLRGGSFTIAYRNLQIITRARKPDTNGSKPLRIGVMHAGGPAPGMNTAVRVALRLGMHAGHHIVAINNGFEGLLDGRTGGMDWMSASGWVSMGGAHLGTSRYVPTDADIPDIVARLRENDIGALMMIGGWAGYRAMHRLYSYRDRYPELNIPLVCLPASINNNLPGSEHSIGTDTALNNIVLDVDKIKQTAVASGRVFVVEVMGRDSGYLALLSGIATGAERVYLPEEGVTLTDLQDDVTRLIKDFNEGQRVGLMIRNENVDALYTTDFMCALFEKESGALFDVRTSILGHVQQGGNPSPYDRIQATRLAADCITFITEEAKKATPAGAAIGLIQSGVHFTPLEEVAMLMGTDRHQRPEDQWWLSLREVGAVMSNRSG